MARTTAAQTETQEWDIHTSPRRRAPGRVARTRREPATPTQLEMRLPTWGGRRRGAGRKPTGPRRRVAHARRQKLTGREPVHVTWRLRDDVWNLQARRCMRLVLRGFIRANGDSFRVTHFSVQGNHVHAIVEVTSTQSLSRGMQGLAVRIARSLNALMERAGKIFADRFHATVLETPRQVQNAIAYVLNNTAKHLREQGKPVPPGPDPYAAGPELDSAASKWAREVGAIATPRTWLLNRGSQQVLKRSSFRGQVRGVPRYEANLTIGESI